MSGSLEAIVGDLRAERVRRGLSQADVAARLGTTQSAIARLEAGKSDLRLSTVLRYAAAVGSAMTISSADRPSLARTAEDVRLAVQGSNSDEALRHVIQFLDDLRRLDTAAGWAAVQEEPGPVGDERWDALLAGIAEYASQLYGFAVPGWATAPRRFLRRFWFVIEDILGRPAPGLAALAFVSSPGPLASRGVFLDREALVSV